ncbi:MAG: TRAP transporter substrate-binding protein DctP [Thermodesulfobacteriota bacterium]
MIIALAASAFGADLSKEDARGVLNESIKALLTGEEFSPALKQKQVTLKEMVNKGAITKEELKDASTQKALLSILNSIRTSRYILQEVPKRVEALLAPHMNWEEVREMVWKAGASVIPDGEKMTITIATLAPTGTPWLNLPEKVLIPQIDRLSGGKVVMKIYSGGVMGEDTDILRKMDIGQIDSCGCTALGILAASPETSVLLLPGLFNNYDEVDYITKKFRKELDSACEKRGYILSSLIDTGNFYLFSKNKISSLADIKKQKVLTWFGTMETTFLGELGIDATPVAVPEIVSAMSTGLADTNLAPAAWMLGMQAYQYVNYYVKQPLLYSPGAALVSINTKDRLRKQFNVSETFALNIQEMLVYEVNTLEDEWRKQSRAYEEKSLAAFEQKCNIKPVTLSPEDMETIRKAGIKTREKLAGQAFSKELMDQVLKALEEYRAHKK